MLDYSSIESHALLKVFRLFAPDSDAKIISYGRNFDALWELETLELGANKIILVWDRPRSNLNLGSINIADFLTPLTWSICAKRRFPELQVAILDLYQQDHSSDRAFRFYSSLLPEKRPFILLNLNDFIPGLIRFVDSSSEPRGKINTLEILTKYLKVLLTERSDEYDPHAIANLIGPLVLLGDRIQTTSKMYSKPLLSLFRWLGLFNPQNDHVKNSIIHSDSQPSEREGKNTSRVTIPSIGTKNKIRALLIDDQEKYGWREWTESMLRYYPEIRLESAETPDVLINTLKAAESLLSKDKDCRFRLDIPIVHEDKLKWGSEPFETILLLDLRLFSEKDIKKEANWIESKIIPLCKHFLSSSPGDDPSAKAGFLSTELDAVKSWCAKPVKNSEGHLIALTLLPRLISLFDYSLPIIIFSNTSKRRIIELFKPFKNIITDFSKPRFTGLESSDLVEETESGFRKALNKAIKWVEARRFCREIIWSAPVFPPPKPVGPVTYRYIELFLDETDWEMNGYFSVGGCFAIFEDPVSIERAISRSELLNDDLVKSGLRHFPNRGIGPMPENMPLKKKSFDDLVGTLGPLSDSSNRPSNIGCLRIQIAKAKLIDNGNPLFNLRVADNRFHRALESLIELFLYVTIPALFPGSQLKDPETLKISIFPGTRIVPIPIKNDQDQIHATFNLGFESKRVINRNNGFARSDNRYYYSFGRSDVYPIVTRILESHRSQRNFHRLLAIQLPYIKHSPQDYQIELPEYFYCIACKKSFFVSQWDKLTVTEGLSYVQRKDNPEEILGCCANQDLRPDYRALHYLADDLLRNFPLKSAGARYDKIFKDRGIVEGEFDDFLDDNLGRLIQSCRSLDQADIIGALVSLPPPPYKSSQFKTSKPRVMNWFLQQLSAKCADMTADDFSRLVASLQAHDAQS